MTGSGAALPAARDTSYRLIGIAMALAGVLAFAIRPILIKLAYAQGADAVTLLALRMTFALPFFALSAVWAARSGGIGLGRGDGWRVAALGFLGYYLASFLDFLGLQHVSAGLGRLLLFVYPTIVVVLSALFLKQPITRRAVAALALTYAGVALVMQPLMGDPGGDLPRGAALVFASAVAFAIYLVAGSRLVQRIGSVRFTAYSMIVASLFCIAQFLLTRPLSALDLPLAVYGIVAVMAVLSTVVPVYLMSEALGRIGANQVSICGAAGPVLTILLGWVGLDESMAAVQVAGAALVLAGVMLATLRPARPG